MTLLEWWQSTKGDLFVSGIAGSVVSAVMEWEGVMPAIRRFIVGFLTAYHLGPAGIPIFAWVFGKVEIPVEQATSVAGFITGIGGIVIVEIILKTLHFKRDRIQRETDGAE